MRYAELAKRNFKEVWRDPLSLALTIGLPVLMLVVLQALGGADEFFEATSLAPGIALFGFVMLMFSAAMTISRDRESALFSRLLTTPLRSSDFVAGYSVPYLPVAGIQAAVIFGIGVLFGLEVAGSILLVMLVLLLVAILFIALGMIIGALFTFKQVPFAYMVILLLAIFGGAWVDIEAIGGVFKTVGDLFPFAHALAAARDVMLDGAGLGDIAGDLYWVLGYTVVIVGLAVLAFRHRMLE
ncbi:MAG: ABC transporter permease [Acidimicrobiia bacterium]|nr:ABC transporter permease [Acidimicrobiia bacterium]MBT8192757.1 ABC transporter permease [Acidimicrobiia bacterium]NNF88010.1 ABC transporter permease [Acidimicrobiia bacterium]NNL12714.1 ABC transporter permease [Acidimicrobiia bacterium]NNL97509.1 ABC transporter permease [Acidimicrobiia bacterium]